MGYAVPALSGGAGGEGAYSGLSPKIPVAGLSALGIELL